MKNKILYDSLVSFAQAACKLLTKSTGGSIPSSPQEILTIEDTGFSVDSVQRLDFHILVTHFREQLTKMPETAKVINLILNDVAFVKPKISDSKGNPVKNPDYSPFVFLEFLALLLRYFENTNSLDFDSETFNSLYNDYENYFYTKKVRYKVYVPLSNFEMEVERLQLTSEIEIRKASYQEINHAYRFGEFPLGSKSLPYETIPNCKFVMAAEYDSDKPIPNLQQCLEEYLWILRVFKEGGFGYGLAYQIPISYPPSSYTPLFLLENPVINDY